MKKFLLLLLFPLFTIADSIELSLDKYHYIISQWILDKSDFVDRYLADINSSVKENRTIIDVSVEVGKFSTQKSFYHNVDFSMQLDLPRLRDKLKVTFQKVREESSLLNRNSEALLSRSSDLKNESYNLALSYSPFSNKNIVFSLDGGVRFNKFFFEPYIGILTAYKIRRDKKVDSNIKNSLRFYLAGEVKNLLLAQYFYKYKEDIVLGWLGSFIYSNELSNQDISSEIFALKLLDKYRFGRVGFIATAHLKHFKNPKTDDFELYFKYHNKLLNKKWLYYEITPSLHWKRKDDYKTSVGIKVKVGATFGAVK